MRTAFVFGIVLLGPLVAEAQRPVRGGRDSAQRGQLEERFRARLADVLRQRLGLDDDQLRRLSEANRRFEGERRTLFREEQDIRREMRRRMLPGDASVNQDSVAALLDRTERLERRKLELFEAEQRELKVFLTPIQRARYLGMQEQLRRQMDEMRERRTGPDGAGGAAPGLRRPRRPGLLDP